MRDYKDAAGERWIDPEREAELLQALVAANPGPLSERGVTLDLLGGPRRAEAGGRGRPARAPRRRHVDRRGTRRRAARRASAPGSSGRRSRSPPAAPAPAAAASTRTAACSTQAARSAASSRRLTRAKRSRTPSSSSSRCRSAPLPPSCGRLLEAAGPRRVVTDVASTKRALAAIDDPRFVPGHPVAGGATGGPARAAADLFDGADLVPDPDRGHRARERRARRAVRRLARRPGRADGRRRARPPARAHEPSPPRARQPPHAARRGRRGSRTTRRSPSRAPRCAR